MPELPEVETVKASLAKALPGKKIIASRVFSPKLRFPIPVHKLTLLSGLEVKSVKRKGKFILVELINNTLIVFHLGMSGHINIFPNSGSEILQLSRHHHVSILFSDNILLTYNDIRRFGLIEIVEANEISSLKLFKNIGVEPFSPDFTLEIFRALLKKNSGSLKNFLMDQKNICGIGNIYASEIMFYANLSPFSLANSLSAQSTEKLYLAIMHILDKAINYGGSTLRNYQHPNSAKGSFQDLHQVYQRHGKNCNKCQAMILKIVQNGRSTFYCEKCQDNN